MITIDGSEGEGGGQVLRTALALSLVTGRPFRIERIRARRKRPGLLRQHLAAVRAAADVGAARVSGDALESATLSFEPARLQGGEYRWNVGSAGSATLVLQAVLPALLAASDASRLTLEGGTHNPSAPPFDFLAQTFLPILRSMGARVEATLERHGFYPAGGGRFHVAIEPWSTRNRVALRDRGATTIRARAIVASLPESVAERELAVVRERLGIDRAACRLERVPSQGPGNCLAIELESEALTEVVTGFGERGVPAETVASGACDEAATYLDAGVPVGIHLADQLLIPMALGQGGTFRTVDPTDHTRTNADVIRRFLDVSIVFAQDRANVHEISVLPPSREPT